MLNAIKTRAGVGFLAGSLAFGMAAVFLSTVFLLAGCDSSRIVARRSGPAIEFTGVPVGGEGDAAKLSTIKGRVVGARPGQQVVIYAHAIDDDGKLTWFVQPFVREPFTKIQSNSKWQNLTHPGSEYAVLLVEPGFQPPRNARALPTEGVVAVATTKGWPPVWQRRWFPFACVIAAAAVTLGLFRAWAFQATRKLQRRFEERLAERTRVAQELHDTLLQGVLSASMQLHVAVEQLPSDSPARLTLNRILSLLSQVVDEGRNTVRGLRSLNEPPNDLERSLVRVQQELGLGEQVDFRVVVEGSPLPLRAAIRDDVYSIGREALVNAFRHSRAESIAVELEYAEQQMKLRVSDDGCGIDSQVLSVGRDGHFGMTGMRERADRIGARLKVYSRVTGGTEVELLIPGHIAFESAFKSNASKWLSRFYPWKPKIGFPHAGPGAES